MALGTAGSKQSDPNDCGLGSTVWTGEKSHTPETTACGPAAASPRPSSLSHRCPCCWAFCTGTSSLGLLGPWWCHRVCLPPKLHGASHDRPGLPGAPECPHPRAAQGPVLLQPLRAACLLTGWGQTPSQLLHTSFLAVNKLFTQPPEDTRLQVNRAFCGPVVAL